ncbi:MAG TPA: hypothetical protein DCZ75_14450 [Geobacter sp.]|nr:hypothetical protein [Geobacter sp.]
MISLSGNGWRLDGVNCVLFDKDGTLVDSHIYWGRIIERRSRAIVRHYGLGGETFDPLCLAMGLDRPAGRLRPEGPIALVSREEVISVVRRELEAMGVEASEAALGELFVHEHKAFLPELFGYVSMLPGVRELLVRLKKLGVKTAVVTTDTVPNTRETLGYLGIDHLFDAVVGKESTKEPKTTGVPATLALQLLGLPREGAVCVGDAPMDLLMAKNGGLQAGIWVATGQIEGEELTQYSPYGVRSLHELRADKN